MAEELTLEEISRITGTKLSLLQEAVGKGYLDARPHRTHVVLVEDEEDLRDKVVAASAQVTSPVEEWEL